MTPAFIMMLLIVFIITLIASVYFVDSCVCVCVLSAHIPTRVPFCVMALQARAWRRQYCPCMACIQIKAWLPAAWTGASRNVGLSGDCRDSHHTGSSVAVWCGPLHSNSGEDTTHFNSSEVWSSSVWQMMLLCCLCYLINSYISLLICEVASGLS